MKTKFVLKAKNLNKKWLEAIKSLYGKQQIIITINTEEDEYLDFAAFDTDDDWWETEEDEWDLLNLNNEEQEEEQESQKEVEESPIEDTQIAKKPRSKRTTTVEPIAEIVPVAKKYPKKEKMQPTKKIGKGSRGPYSKTKAKTEGAEETND